MTLSLNTGNAKAPLSERGDDYYPTPACAVHALMRAEKLPEVIWECACGKGEIALILREAGHKVYATDLVDRGCPDSHGIDFLMEKHPSFHVGCVVTNPPFKLADKFVAHALTLGVPKVCMLVRTLFIEGQGRTAILDGGLLARVHTFADRLPMFHREDPRGAPVIKKHKKAAMSFSWFVWELGNTRSTELRRIWAQGAA
jgi:hypothetical protein